MGPIKSQSSVNIALLAEGTFLNFFIQGDDIVFPLHALTFACRFTVVHPCFVACGNQLQQGSPFVLIYEYKLL